MADAAMADAAMADASPWTETRKDPYPQHDFASLKAKLKAEEEARKKQPRHAVKAGAIPAELVEECFGKILAAFEPQLVQTNNYPDWKLSSYLEYTEKKNPAPGTVPALYEACAPLLPYCDELFLEHHCRLRRRKLGTVACQRLQSFVTRYKPCPMEDGLPLASDSVGICGSVVLGLPTPEPFEGGGLSVWDAARSKGECTDDLRVDYPMRPGDVCFLDKLVWHQANAITAGDRWALVIFYRTSRVQVAPTPAEKADAPDTEPRAPGG